MKPIKFHSKGIIKWDQLEHERRTEKMKDFI